MSFLFGSNKENKTFRNQQSQAFEQQNIQSQFFRDATNDFRDMMMLRYGQQSRIFNLLEDNLNASMSYGPGQLQPNANDFFRENGFLPGEGPAGAGGAGGGGGGGSFQERVARARAEREAGGGGSSGPNPWDWNPMSGYDPSMFNLQFTPRRFYASEGAALRSQMSEEATDKYGDAAAAFGRRAQQLGGYSPGLEAEMLRDMEAEKAREQMTGQRQAILFGAQNIRDDMRAFAGPRTQLALGQAEALAREAGMQNQIMAQRAAQQAAAAEGARNRAAAARAAGAAQRAAQQQWSASQRQRAAEFAAEMKLKGAQFNSENFFRSIGAMSGLAGMTDPQGYMNGILGGLGGPASIYGNIYNTGSQGMVNTRQPGIMGNLIGGALGAIGGNWGSIFGGGSRGGSSSVMGGQNPWSQQWAPSNYFGMY